MTDLRRGLDYLETRDDLDRTRIAYCGTSGGVRFGLILAALETRYRSVVFASGGIRRSYERIIDEARPTNFAPHVRQPKLVMNGRYDENIKFRSEIEPYYKLLSEPKRQYLYDGGHAPPLEHFVPSANAFLDETLGAVGGRQLKTKNRPSVVRAPRCSESRGITRRPSCPSLHTEQVAPVPLLFVKLLCS